MLSKRLVTGPLLIALLLGVVYLDGVLAGRPLPAGLGSGTVPPGTALAVIGLVGVSLAAIEIGSVLTALQARPNRALLVLAAISGLLIPWLTPLAGASTGTAIAATVPMLAFSAAMLTAVSGRRTDGATLATAGTLFVHVYPGLAIGSLLALRLEHSAWWIVGVVLTVKSCDIGAYFTGRAIGRTKLIEWLSPKKTWEGLAGGMLLSGLVGLGAAALSTRLADPGDHVSLAAGLLLGILFGGLGQLGDLAMSVLKRDAGIKDSSSVLPGMGGIMDVLDSPALVAPIALWLVPLAASL